MLLGVLGRRFGFDLGSKIEMSTKISEIQESMLSPAWEHGFPMAFMFWDGFWRSLRSSGELWRPKLRALGRVPRPDHRFIHQI